MCQAQRAMVAAPRVLAMPHWSPGSQGGLGVFLDCARMPAGSAASNGAAHSAMESARTD
jgi:hypothetical protein